MAKKSIEEFADYLFRGREVEFHVGKMKCFASIYTGERIGKEVCVNNYTIEEDQYFGTKEELINTAKIGNKLLKDCWEKIVIDHIF